jgi:hypothetical protein
VLDITVDGVKEPRPGGPVARAFVKEFGI